MDAKVYNITFICCGLCISLPNAGRTFQITDDGWAGAEARSELNWVQHAYWEEVRRVEHVRNDGWKRDPDTSNVYEIKANDLHCWGYTPRQATRGYSFSKSTCNNLHTWILFILIWHTRRYLNDTTHVYIILKHMDMSYLTVLGILACFFALKAHSGVMHKMFQSRNITFHETNARPCSPKCLETKHYIKDRNVNAFAQ